MGKIYKSKRWLVKRQHILRMDKFMCMECKRYGKRVDATTVHHVYPVKDYPEYIYCDWNLMSLCTQCHNAMHDRTTNQLTSKGEGLTERTTPPQDKGKYEGKKTEGGIDSSNSEMKSRKRDRMHNTLYGILNKQEKGCFLQELSKEK